MSRRKRQEAKTPQQTRKEILRERKTARDRQMLLGVLLPVLGIVAVIVGLGMMRELYQKPRQPVARVEGQNIPASEYIDRLAYERLQLLNNLQTFSQLSITSEGNEDFLTNFASQSRGGLPERTVDLLVDEALVREEAAKRGIEVTDQEVTDEIYSQLPSADAFATLQAGGSPTTTLSAEELESPPTEEPVVSEAGDTETISATATAKMTVTLSAAGYAGATREAERDYETIVREGVLTRTGLSESRYREIVRSQLFSEKVEKAMADEVESTAEQVEIAYMAFPSASTAEEAHAQLEKGASWEDVAAEFRDPAKAAESITTTETAGLSEAGALEPLSATGSISMTPGFSATTTLTAEGSGAPEDPAEVLAEAGITTTVPNPSGVITASVASPTPAPSPTPDPFASVEGERTWFTRQGLKDTLGLSDEEAGDLLAGEKGKPVGPLDGKDGSYVILVYDADKGRELPKDELQAKKDGALEAWLQTRRIQAAIDRFPLESVTTPEPAWFTTLYEQIVGVPVDTLPTSAIAVSTVVPTAAGPQIQILPTSPPGAPAAP